MKRIRSRSWLLAFFSAALPLFLWGQIQISVEQLEDGQFQITWPLAEEPYILESASDLSFFTFWQAVPDVEVTEENLNLVVVDLEGERRFFRLRIDGFSVRVIEVSPMAGEEMVNVNREIIVRFDGAIDETSLSESSFQLFANGSELPGSIRLSSTKLFASFVPDQPLPDSTEILVKFDGDQVLSEVGGQEVDADEDGNPGGILESRFRTLSLTRITGTVVFGFVRDSFSDEPIAGVTVRADGIPSLTSVTGADGRFELVDVPAPEFFVHIGPANK